MVDRQLLQVVEAMGRTWGWQWRRNFGEPEPVAIGGLNGKIQDYGTGALSGPLKQNYPDVFIGDGLLFNCVLKRIPEKHRTMAWIHYAVPAPAKVKAPIIGIHEQTYWQRRNAMRRAIAKLIDI